MLLSFRCVTHLYVQIFIEQKNGSKVKSKNCATKIDLKVAMKPSAQVGDPEVFFAHHCGADEVIATQRRCHEEQKLVPKKFGKGTQAMTRNYKRRQHKINNENE
jgi:hypothetical protein